MPFSSHCLPLGRITRSSCSKNFTSLTLRITSRLSTTAPLSDKSAPIGIRPLNHILNNASASFNRFHAEMNQFKTTIAENLGKNVPAHSLASSDSQFSLEQVPDLTGKVALVTGGSEGIGYGCTHTLLTHGVSKLIILSKSSDVASECIDAIKKELGDSVGEKVEWYQCDLSNWEETGRTAFKIKESIQRLDVLISNAARGVMTAQKAGNGVDLHMAGNHMGHVVLTSHLLPVLKATAKKGNKVRIVNLGSNAHESAPKETKFETLEELNKDFGPVGQYGRSKLANILYSKYLHRHLGKQYPNIIANATHPGLVETRQSTEHIKEAYPLGGYLVSDGLSPFKKDQCEGAVSTMYAATVAEQGGQYICPPAIVERGSDMANDDELGEKLMDLTWKIVKEKTEPSSAQKGCPFKEY